MKRFKKEFIVKENSQRLDIYLSENLCLFTRSQIKKREVKAFKSNNGVFVSIKLSKPVFVDDKILIEFDEEVNISEYVRPLNLPISILYEDINVIVVDKPQGILSHPGISNLENTVVNFLLYHISDLQDSFHEDKIRPGIVHRLDKETSGVMICAKNLITLNFLSRQFKERVVKKVYIAVVKGNFKIGSGIIETFIDRDRSDRKKFSVHKNRGKKALTEYKVFVNMENYSLVALRPQTGRTHQLRVHMKYLNHPILGDNVYSKLDKGFKEISLMLHAFKLEINIKEGSLKKFISGFPQRFINFLSIFYGKEELNSLISNFIMFLERF
ncbi:RluA family pseudouridine synthase [Borrelia miyamotoi]|uniref:Pseudouridine synthase n=1 Tax=Borrelia miyamotoi TaxID=47466 RepID=A0AAQ3AHB8_9SPIR|nr:RluA family pseudouridine synthase [Borrelia miyamotoi]AGT27023.1 ribosomal large subunit pseudouridine synthase D [Borrelia miyamotoi LB-2001]AJA58236.1 pseudouridine synthase [Borrelia miyamotoi]AOW95312.1 RNA pseudouridine synthase [Borrelia miyamotoi]QTL83190.1 RluA family pseudouridine synthase [Borrelia miyamotoi]WAZ85523.1 RluA family pseudouridine synthase [Borrelia miyamotoi]